MSRGGNGNGKSTELTPAWKIMEASGDDLYSYRGNRIAEKTREEKTSSNEFPVKKALTSTKEKCASPVCVWAQVCMYAYARAHTIASTSHMFSSFKKRRFIDHQVFGTVRSSMIYSSHGRSTWRYIVVDGRIAAIERISK